MATAKWIINAGEQQQQQQQQQQDLRYPAARINEKGCLQVWGCGDAPSFSKSVVGGDRLVFAARTTTGSHRVWTFLHQAAKVR